MDWEPGKETPIIKQAGLQRSGTNFLKALLMENFDCIVFGYLGGNKHRLLRKLDFREYNELTNDLTEKQFKYYTNQMKAGKFKTIAIYKNPFAWLSSFWMAYGVGELDKANIIKWIEIYNFKNLEWKITRNYMVDYHKLITDTEVELDRIGKELNLTRKSKVLSFDKATGKVAEYFGERLFTEDNFEVVRYTNHLYMDYFTKDQIKLITSINIFYEDISAIPTP